MKYKKYIVFAYDHYYPSGALDDIFDSFDSLDEAKSHAKNVTYRPDRHEEFFSGAKDVSKIVDRDTWEIIE